MLYRLSQITKQYDNRTVLNLEALKIKKSMIYALLGPNGSGKSTLLNLLAFLEKPNSGTLSYAEQPVTYTEASLLRLRRKVVLVDQYPIFFSTTVYKNLEFGLKIRQLSKETRQKRIIKALTMVGLEDFADKKAHTLSGGENKRIALARALVLQPQVLLCDEPFANVDPSSQEQILGILEEINSKHNISLIFSSHDRPQAGRLAHKTLHLRDGILSEGEKPNTFNGTIFWEDKTRPWFIATNQARLEIPMLENIPPQVNTKVNLQLAPEQLRLSTPDLQSDLRSCFIGTIKHIEESAGRIRVVVENRLRLEVQLSIEDYHNNPPLVGEKIKVTIPFEAAKATPIQA